MDVRIETSEVKKSLGDMSKKANVVMARAANRAEIKGKNYEIKSYLFSVDARGRGILKFTGSDYETMIFRQISSCFADGSCTVFKNKDNVSFVVYNG